MVWLFPTTLTNNNRILFKGPSAGNIHSFFIFTGNNLQLTVQGSTALNKQTNDAPLSTNRWFCVAGVYDFGVSGSLYTGALDGSTRILPLSLRTLGVDTNGVTVGDDSAASFVIGRNELTSAQFFQGAIGFVGVWRRQLGYGELLAAQMLSAYDAGLIAEPPPAASAVSMADCVLWMPLGDSLSTQIDYSPQKNHGTVTGGVLTPPIPGALPVSPFPFVGA